MIRQANKLDIYNIVKLIIAGWQNACKWLLYDNFLNNMSINIMTKNFEINSKQNII